MACAPSGFRYIANPELGAFLRLPDDWTVFNDSAVLDRQTRELPSQVAEQVRRAQWAVAFDADPDPSLEHFFGQFADPSTYPTGYLRVRALGPQELEEFSEASLRNELIRIDALRGADPTRVESHESGPIDAGAGTHGLHTVVTIRLDGGDFTLDQRVLVDEDAQVMHLLVIGCEAACYRQHRSVIDEVGESWTVGATAPANVSRSGSGIGLANGLENGLGNGLEG